jgi:hypothetical protein
MQQNPFADLPRTPGEHFKLCFYNAVLLLLRELIRLLGSFEEVAKQFPFLVGYIDEIAGRGVEGLTMDAAALWWRQSIEAWEDATDTHLPLRALRRTAGIDQETLMKFLCVGMTEEDSRFGDLFASIQSPPGQRRPTYGLLNSWQDQSGADGEMSTPLQGLINAGLLQALNPTSPRSEWLLQVPIPLWDALRGAQEVHLADWLTYSAPSSLMDLQQLILSESVREQLAEISQALVSGKARGVIVRGARRNSRRTAIKAIAKSLSLGVLEITGLDKSNDERWKIVGPLATALHAMALVVPELSPGENAALPALTAHDGPVAVVLGRQGGVSGVWAERAITLDLDVPDPSERKEHWLAGSGMQRVGELEAVSERYRMTRGNIYRAVAIATSYAAVKHKDAIQLPEAQRAIRTLGHEVFDGLAERIDTSGDWSHLATSRHTFEELHSLERRCRHREGLLSAVSPVLGLHLNSGVRALFSGPSGTGKTLAARLLAASLRMDLYRINLATVVNKYIGETEKNLNLVLSRAEELPIMLLLDEGDALLTQRTNVHTSNDRYANLETDFLLQRLESFDGIMIVTTNAGDHIDGAFLRRMDVVIDFIAPDLAERWALWTMFLPTTHSVDHDVLSEIVFRCALTGGQIRNAVLHASLLALSNGGIVVSEYLETAVQREYRKSGTVCPLRKSGAGAG